MHESGQMWWKSRITHSVYPSDSHRFVPDVIRDLRFVDSQPLAVFARTWFALICLWCVYLYTLFMHFGGSLVYSESFSSQVGWLTSADQLVVVCDGSQMGLRIMNLTNSWIVYREQFVEIRTSQFICANGAQISDSCESCTVYSRH